MHMKETNGQKFKKGDNSNKILLNWLKIKSVNFLLSTNQYIKYGR